MRFQVASVIGGLVILLALACGGSPEPPAVPRPDQRMAGRGYTVLVQETLERETMFVVTVPNGTNTDRGVLLAMGNELHTTRGEHHKTAVIFQAPGKVAGQRRSIEQQYANAFAVAIIDAEKGSQEIRFGIFN
jgi:hypothetical protein